jgi:hypothetical protein
MLTCRAWKQVSVHDHKSRHLRRETLCRVLQIAAVFSCLGTSAPAQSLAFSNVFVGYSFIGANLYTGQHANLNGWNISAEKKYLPFFGVVADFSGHYGSKDLPVTCANSSSAGCVVNSSISEHYFQFGVRGSYATTKIRPFIELLFGVVHTSENGAALSNSNNSLAETLDTGLDYRITHRLSWRIDGGLVKSGSFNSQQNSLRASTGVVLRF